MPKSVPVFLALLALSLVLPAAAHNNPVFFKRPVLLLQVQPSPDGNGDHSAYDAVEFDRDTIRFHYEVISSEPVEAIRFTVQGDAEVLGTDLAHGGQTGPAVQEASDAGRGMKRARLRIRDVTGATRPFSLIIRAEEPVR